MHLAPPRAGKAIGSARLTSAFVARREGFESPNRQIPRTPPSGRGMIGTGTTQEGSVMVDYDRSTALVVVDVQNDFADAKGSLYVGRG